MTVFFREVLVTSGGTLLVIIEVLVLICVTTLPETTVTHEVLVITALSSTISGSLLCEKLWRILPVLNEYLSCRGSRSAEYRPSERRIATLRTE